MNGVRTRIGRLVVAAATVMALGGAAIAQKMQINGAGATFPQPIYTKWFSEYNKVHPNVEINYQPLGSGAGIQQLISQTVFFGASDQPMTDEVMKTAPGRILHFPTVLGGVVPIFNIPGVTAEVKLTGPLLADIFLGRVTKWNDPAIAKLNPGVTFPKSDIVVVHRSDGSGTTFIFTDFLSKISPAWKAGPGTGGSVKWPSGVGAKGSDGVAGQVSQQPGSIGYVELVFATQNKIAYGAVQNQAGEFVKASLESVTAAAAAAASSMPADFRVSITNAAGKGVYPISSFTWMLFYETPKDKAQARTMVDFMTWALSDGQKLAGPLGYAPVPANVVKMETAALKKIVAQ